MESAGELFPWIEPYLAGVSGIEWRAGGSYIGHYIRNESMVPGTDLMVIVSPEIHGGKRWVHVSCSRPDRLPSWKDLRNVKDCFIGKDKKAVSILPPEAEYVNVHPYCLHLWHCLDGDGLPDFRRQGIL